MEFIRSASPNYILQGEHMFAILYIEWSRGSKAVVLAVPKGAQFHG